MPTIQWRDLRRDIARPFGLLEGVASEPIASNTSIVISDELANEYGADGTFNGQFLLMVTEGDGSALASANAANPTRRIREYWGDQGRLVLAGSGLAASTSGLEFDIYKLNPRFVLRSYNRARADVFPRGIGIVRQDDITITDPSKTTYDVPADMREVFSIYIRNELTQDGLSADEYSYRPLSDWYQVPAIDGGKGYGQIYFNRGFQVDRQIRMFGRDILSEATGDSSNIELDGDWLDPVIYRSQAILARDMAVMFSDEREEYMTMEEEFNQEYERSLQEGVSQTLPIPDMRFFPRYGLTDRERMGTLRDAGSRT